MKLIGLVFVLFRLGFSLDSAPSFIDVNTYDGYKVYIKENTWDIHTVPEIKAKGDVCEFRIETQASTRNFNQDTSIPFIIIKNTNYKDTDGNAITSAILEAVQRPNCEHRQFYNFDIKAYSCSGSASQPVSVHVIVEDENEHEPKFLQQSYVADVVEGQLFDSIIQVHAEDDDCSTEFNKIENYKILEQNVPFSIDEYGNIRNTEALSYKNRHNWILTVVAFDSSSKRSNEAAVNIRVKRNCKLGWHGVKERQVYHAKEGERAVMGSAELEICDDVSGSYARGVGMGERKCVVAEKIEAKLSLEARQIGKGCDMDADSNVLRSRCGGSTTIEELLPAPNSQKSWTASIPRDQSSLTTSDSIFHFDGRTTYAIVPSSVLPVKPRNNFTLTFWMKHNRQSKVHSDKKETIVCDSDEREHSRHHFTVFVRNCKLIMLLRKEASLVDDPKGFRPSEWRWHVPEVCDNEWHNFAISVNFPDAKLFIDGNSRNDDTTLQILDDWPLHKIPNISTRFTIGAAWQGAQYKMDQFFNGYLSQVNLLVGKAEKESVLKCLRKCQESLDFPRLEDLSDGMQVRYSRNLNQVTVTGSSPRDVQRIVQQISYVNSRSTPTPGVRFIDVDTTVVCKTEETYDDVSFVLPPVRIQLEVKIGHDARLLVSGPTEIEVRTVDIREGFAVFQNVVLSVVQEIPSSDVGTLRALAMTDLHLKHCLVDIHPIMDPSYEEIIAPPMLLEQFGMIIHADDEHIRIEGEQSVDKYIQILQRLMYFSNAKVIPPREFSLICETNNAASVRSAEYKLVVQPILSDPSTVHMGALEPDSEHVTVEEILQNPMPDSSSLLDGSQELSWQEPTYMQHSGMTFSNSGKDGAITVFAVIGLTIVVSLIIFGIVKVSQIRRKKRRQEQEEAEMMWDDSAMTITVNPFETRAPLEVEYEDTNVDDSDEFSERSGSEVDEDEEYDIPTHCKPSSREEVEFAGGNMSLRNTETVDRDLEWDDQL